MIHSEGIDPYVTKVERLKNRKVAHKSGVVTNVFPALQQDERLSAVLAFPLQNMIMLFLEMLEKIIH